MEAEAERRGHPVATETVVADGAGRVERKRAREVPAIVLPYAEALAPRLEPLLGNALERGLDVVGPGLVRPDVEEAGVALVISRRLVQFAWRDDSRVLLAGRCPH